MTEIINRFLKDMQLVGKRPATIEAYAMRLKSFVAWLREDQLKFETVQHEQINDYKRYLQLRNLKPATIKARLATVTVLYQWAVTQGIVATVPVTSADYPPSRPDRIKRMTDEELQLFKAYINQLQPNLRAAFWCLLGTGCRVGEVAKLHATDVTLRGRRVYVQITDAKWGSDRTIPVIDETAAKIVWQFRQEIAVDNQPLFRVKKRTLQWYATQFANQTGVAFKCHLLRHTFAAKLTEQGVPITTIQYLLGHRSVAMTAYYAQAALVAVDQIAPQI